MDSIFDQHALAAFCLFLVKLPLSSPHWILLYLCVTQTCYLGFKQCWKTHFPRSGRCVRSRSVIRRAQRLGESPLPPVSVEPSHWRRCQHAGWSHLSWSGNLITLSGGSDTLQWSFLLVIRKSGISSSPAVTPKKTQHLPENDVIKIFSFFKLCSLCFFWTDA